MTTPPESGNPGTPTRDIWRDIGWGVARGLGLAALPLLLTVLPGRLPIDPSHPRPAATTGVTFGILALGASLGAVAGVLRPLSRSLSGSLLIGFALAETALFLIRVLTPARPDAPPFEPLVPGLIMGLILGVALYASEVHRRTQSNSLSG